MFFNALNDGVDQTFGTFFFTSAFLLNCVEKGFTLTMLFVKQDNLIFFILFKYNYLQSLPLGRSGTGFRMQKRILFLLCLGIIFCFPFPKVVVVRLALWEDAIQDIIFTSFVKVQFSGIPSPRYEWYYRPNDEAGSPTEDFQWTMLQATQDNVLYFDPFTFSDSGR